jgi:hypothetical protein
MIMARLVEVFRPLCDFHWQQTLFPHNCVPVVSAGFEKLPQTQR